jgi:subtilisin family serine protease
MVRTLRLFFLALLVSGGLRSSEPEAFLVAIISAPTDAQDPVVKDNSSDIPSGLNPNPWRWNFPASSGKETDGNWGLEAIRVPQLWNLNDFVRRAGHWQKFFVGILDAGFEDRDGDGIDDHPDLKNLKTVMLGEDGKPKPGAITNYHGQHVAGIIGATFNNRLGIDGVNPFARMIGISPKIPQGQDWRASWGTLIETLAELLKHFPNIRVVNVSMSYNWPVNTRLKVNPNLDGEAQKLVIGHGLLMRRLAALYPNVLFFAAAGNDSPKRFNYPTEIHAQWASPLNWAALAPDFELDGELFKRAENILVIESFDAILPGEHNYRKSDFSNVGGHFSAPGGRILSTVLREKYDTLDGTSMAAPHVTGLVSYLVAFDPTLTISEIKELLQRSARAIEPESAGGRGPNGEGPAPRIDAFSALIALDSLRSDRPVQRALVDVDDCTPDGNLRVDAHGRMIAALCPDGLRGDGNIDMRDFRAFRDALLYAEGKLKNLDGAPNHPKKDLNGDGCVHDADPKTCPIPENAYARFDFNGDGLISREMRSEFNGSLLTDLEVLMGVWGSGPSPDTEGWQAHDLLELLDSADVHVDLTSLGSFEQLEISVSGLPERLISSERRWVTVTVPAGRALQIVLRNGVLRLCAPIGPLEPGQDLWVVPKPC